MEVHNIVQEAVIKTMPKEKKCKIAKWLSEEVLQIAKKRRDVKGIFNASRGPSPLLCLESHDALPLATRMET